MQKIPDDRRRINLTLPPELHGVLDDLARESGTSKATLIREVLMESIDQLRAMVEFTKLAKERNLDSLSLLAKAMRDISHQAAQADLDLRAVRHKRLRKARTEKNGAS